MESTTAEQQQRHGKSSSDAAELLDIMVEDVAPEALRCPKCLHPLKHPVFQCAAGHQVCSICYDNIADKNKCASCFITTGFTRCFIRTTYTRCHDVERVLQSFRVACPYTPYGCIAGKMLYHEKVEHEKTCHTKDWVVKTGPCGGSDGKDWDMDVRGLNRIIKLVVWHRSCALDAMSVMYERDGREEQTEVWGKPIPSEGERSEICLELDEYLTGVKGHVGNLDGQFVVRSLTFGSNRRTFGPYGEEDGVPFELPAHGGRIIGFHGRSGWYMNALGTYVKMEDWHMSR